MAASDAWRFDSYSNDLRGVFQVWCRPARCGSQTSPPEIPRLFGKSARLRLEHHFDELVSAERCFETQHIFQWSEIHRLRENSEVRARLCADMLPPEKLALQLGRKVRRKAEYVRCAHLYREPCSHRQGTSLRAKSD